MTTISLKISETLFRRLESEAKILRTTKSRLIRDSLDRMFFMKTEKSKASCLDLAGDLEGCVKGLPKDLATNQKYMNGFGQ